MDYFGSPNKPNMFFSFRLGLARFARVVIANVKFTISSLRKGRPKTQHSFAAILRSFFYLSVLFVPALYYVFFLASSGPTRPGFFIPLYPIFPPYPPSGVRPLEPVQLPPGHIPAPRRSRQNNTGVLPFSPSQDPTIRLLFACDASDPCCDTTFAPALRAALKQTLAPNHLSFLHACTESNAHRADPLLESVHHLVAETLNESIYETSISTPQVFISFHVCTPTANDTVSLSSPDMELCILRYLATSPSNSSAVKPGSYVMLLTPSFILEPTALESLWLYLFVHPTVAAVRPLSYHPISLHDALVHRDPLRVNFSYPNASTHDITPVRTLPLMIPHDQFSVSAAVGHVDDETALTSSNLWLALSHLMARSRILRIPLTTHIDIRTHIRFTNAGISGSPPPPPDPMLTLRRDKVPIHLMLPHLWSEHVYYKWSARTDNREKYHVQLQTDDEKNSFDFWGMPFRRVEASGKYQNNPRVMFVMPWIQMGGSEKCMLDVAHEFVRMKWPITFVLTMPFWNEDGLGELSLKHEWIGKALAITPDVFDIVALSPNHKFSKVLRYLLETRSPDYIFTANARVIYEHLAYIKQVSPKTMIADYNHMVHMDWQVVPGQGGGMPRYGTTYTENIDLHLTASDNVTTSMKSWIDPSILAQSPNKVQTCYIGTDPDALHSDDVKPIVRAHVRKQLGISSSTTVVLFAGRYVADKGIDVMGEVVRRIAQDDTMASKLAFVFVGSGDQYDMLERTQKSLTSDKPKMILRPPAVGLDELRDYYAMADIFLLPSNNEGIALVLYEAMAAGLLVMSTDVGGQRELIRTDTGVLLPLLNNVQASASFIVHQLLAISKFSSMFSEVQENGQRMAREKYTTKRFCECVIENMKRAKENLERGDPAKSPQEKAIVEMQATVADVMRGERIHGLWNLRQVQRSMEGQVTVGVKTYVCDDSIVRQVVGLVRTIRVNYPKVRILLANDGPTRIGTMRGIVDDEYTEEVILPADSGISIGRNVMVNMTTTEFFLLLDDDHVFDDDTDLRIGANGVAHYDFDIVGIRVRNLPGIDELERVGIFIPRYVAKVSKFENREVTLCVWNENNGPGVQKMRVPIRVDVLHNALIAKTDVLRAHPWRNILKVNEHMSFFLDAREADLHVGYLPSVFVHHRARRYSDCYKQVRFREDKYEQLLDYKDSYNWDVPCGDDFPNVVKDHLEATNGM